MARSYHNKILRVNLTDRSIRVEEPGNVYWRRYMGGWNVIADVLLKEVPVGADPLGPENKLIFAPGVLTGLPISGASRSSPACSRSVSCSTWRERWGRGTPSSRPRWPPSSIPVMPACSSSCSRPCFSPLS